MNPTSHERSTRREVLIATARYAATGGIALLSAGLVVKSQLTGGGRRCYTPASACRGCQALAECERPAALRLRRAQEG